MKSYDKNISLCIAYPKGKYTVFYRIADYNTKTNTFSEQSLVLPNIKYVNFGLPDKSKLRLENNEK